MQDLVRRVLGEEAEARLAGQPRRRHDHRDGRWSERERVPDELFGDPFTIAVGRVADDVVDVLHRRRIVQEIRHRVHAVVAAIDDIGGDDIVAPTAGDFGDRAEAAGGIPDRA